MPMYGFVCNDCGEAFEELVFSTTKIDQVTCPACGSKEVRKQLSRVAAPVTGSSSNLGATSCAPGGT